MRNKTSITIFVVIMLIFSITTTTFAASKGVLESLFQVYIGEQKVTVPLHFSLTCYDKKPGKVSYERAEIMGSVPKLPAEIIKSDLDKFKGQPLMYWYPEMGTLPEVPAGKGAEIVIEHNLYFAGVENYIEAAMSPDGGKTLYIAERQENKSWTVNLEGVKMPPGARALSWYLRHKDNKSFVVIFIVKLTSNAEGISSSGIYLGCRALPPEVQDYYSRLSTRAKRSFFEGMRDAEADCTAPEMVKAEILELAKQDQQVQIQSKKCEILFIGRPGEKFEATYIGASDAPLQLTMGPDGKYLLQNRNTGTIIKARLVGSSQWQNIPTVPGRVEFEFPRQAYRQDSGSLKKQPDTLVKFINFNHFPVNLVVKHEDKSYGDLVVSLEKRYQGTFKIGSGRIKIFNQQTGQSYGSYTVSDGSVIKIGGDR